MTTWMIVAILLVFLGLMMLLAEAFVPSGGILTAMAVLSGGGGIAVAFIKIERPLFGIVLVVCALILAPTVFLVGLSNLPRTFFGKKIVLRRPEQHGWTATDPEPEYQGLLDLEGEAVSPLRPAGIAEFSGRRYDVVTEGRMVAKGAAVKVIEVEANRIVVRPVEVAVDKERTV